MHMMDFFFFSSSFILNKLSWISIPGLPHCMLIVTFSPYLFCTLAVT
jgi:hypothetical protein